MAMIWACGMDKKLTGTSILFAEKEFFDNEHAAKVARKIQRQSAHKCKGSKILTAQPPTKWPKLGGSTNSTVVRLGVSSMASGMSVEEEASDSELDPEQESMHIPVSSWGLAELEGALEEAVQRMDYLINAENCTGLKYRCRVLDVCFKNNAAASICYDIHHPEEFANLMSSILKPPSAPPFSHIPKYNPMQHDHMLQNTLDEWREQTMLAVYGWHHLNDIGLSIVMCNAMLECIVNCAHHHKISSIQDLRREMTWPDVDQHGGEVLSLI
ncbi:hypothetical protein F5141DRAFT_1063610 [Pisolithus sp. B1]|nr:hypothetical protein F5141DRAFT_1063610 [Pisolithus sp. B1]